MAVEAVELPVKVLAEGGIYDEGDLEVWDSDGRRWVLECRNRGAMNVHGALAAARVKAAGSGLVAVVWKRLRRKPGAKRRTQAGPPVVVLPLETFLSLLRDHRRP